MSEWLCTSHHIWLSFSTTKSLAIINKKVKECGYLSENIIVVRLKFQYFCLLTPARHALYRFVALTGYIVAWILLSSTWSKGFSNYVNLPKSSCSRREYELAAIILHIVSASSLQMSDSLIESGLTWEGGHFDGLFRNRIPSGTKRQRHST